MLIREAMHELLVMRRLFIERYVEVRKHPSFYGVMDKKYTREKVLALAIAIRALRPVTDLFWHNFDVRT